MPKYEYAFDRINLEDFPLIGLDTEPFQKVLQARGKEGWVYSGYLPIKEVEIKFKTVIELVFRREIPENE